MLRVLNNAPRISKMSQKAVTAMSDAIIGLSEVSKTYAEGQQVRKALDGLSLCIERGQFVSIMGPSGSGKTTLLNLIAGIDTPDRGRVIVGGMDLSTMPDHQLADLRLHTIGFVFQAFNLLPALTVERNVRWPLQFSGRPPAEVRARAARALERVGIVNYDGLYPGQLSGGEQQRVAIARAVAGDPAILLADEPTGNLDSRSANAVLDLLRKVTVSHGVTTLMITHNEHLADRADRVLFMRDGRRE